MDTPISAAQAMLGAYGLQSAHLAPLRLGHINATFVVTTGADRHIFQQLNPIFVPEIHFNIEAVTRHLADRGQLTPRLIPNQAGALWTLGPRGEVWRLQTYIDGRAVVQPESAAMCRSAGQLLGTFHRLVADVEHDFSGIRSVHDLDRHLAGLKAALDAHRDHVAYGEVAPLAAQVLGAIGAISRPRALIQRVVHGDPKISNFVFDAEGEARALIDLDTLAPMAVPLELGDAFRSWCNPGGEGEGITDFRMDYFSAGLEGYAHGVGQVLGAAEQEAIPDMVELITLELATRFLRDALEESYFGWDNERFDAAWQHNLLRAQSQWALARAYNRQKGDAKVAAAQIFSAS